MKRPIVRLVAHFSLPLSAWPAGVMVRILDDAERPLPPSRGPFLKDFDSVLGQPSKSVSGESVAITEWKTKRADLSTTAAVILEVG